MPNLHATAWQFGALATDVTLLLMSQDVLRTDQHWPGSRYSFAIWTSKLSPCTSMHWTYLTASHYNQGSCMYLNILCITYQHQHRIWVLWKSPTNSDPADLFVRANPPHMVTWWPDLLEGLARIQVSWPVYLVHHAQAPDRTRNDSNTMLWSGQRWPCDALVINYIPVLLDLILAAPWRPRSTFKCFSRIWFFLLAHSDYR